jgi:hypothetical protein
MSKLCSNTHIRPKEPEDRHFNTNQKYLSRNYWMADPRGFEPRIFGFPLIEIRRPTPYPD